jgi:hypothetical protein
LFGYAKKNLLFPLGLALTMLTRIDGAIFAVCLIVASLVSDKSWGFRSAFLVLVLQLPWFGFAFLYTGNILPQSLLAKMSAYRFDFMASASPFLGAFTPFLESNPAKWIGKFVLFACLVFGGRQIVKRHSELIPVVIFCLLYSLLFMASRAAIFRWYVIPAVFVSYVVLGTGCEWVAAFPEHWANMQKAVRSIVIVLAAVASLITLSGRLERYGQLQSFEDGFRKEIGLWLNKNIPPGSVIFLEPIGYIGYYAGPQLRILDEIGIVTPQIVQLRKCGAGWYTHAAKTLRPDYIVQYQFAIDHNQMEGTQERLFTSDDDAASFLAEYKAVKVFSVSQSYPLIGEREKAYVLLQRQ